jgi:hypothetical protein
MPTLKQIAANRRNAKESTGPKTEAGKATASRNTFRHGILALAEGCLPWESPGELAELHRQMMEDWHPRGFTELAIVESMVADMWRMRRLQRTELGVELNNTLAIASRRMEEERQQGYRYERITWGPAAFAEPPAAQAASEAHPEDVYVYRATVEDFGQASNLYFSLWSTLYCKAKECCQSRPDPCLGGRLPTSRLSVWASRGNSKRASAKFRQPFGSRESGAGLFGVPGAAPVRALPYKSCLGGKSNSGAAWRAHWDL